MTFAERLRSFREERGMTQAQLAEASGLPLGSIRNYEQAQREPYWGVVFKLADALGVSCEAFKDCVPESPPEDAPARGKGKADKPAAKRQRRRKGE